MKSSSRGSLRDTSPDTIKIIGEHCPSLQSIYIGGNYISQINTLKQIIQTYIKNIKTIDGHNI